MLTIRRLAYLAGSILLISGAAQAQGQSPVWVPAPATPAPAQAQGQSPVWVPAPATAAPQAQSGSKQAAPQTTEIQDPAARGAAGDPNLDRSFLVPTAMTQPKGSLTYSNYELMLHGLTYGFTNRLQASLTVLPPYVKDIPFVATLSVKGQVVRSDRFHVALQGSVTMANADHDNAFGFTTGALFSACLSEDCASLVSAGLTMLLSSESKDFVLAYSGSLTQRLSEHSKLLLEVASGAYHDGDGFEGAPGALINYGVRFHGHNFAGDIGFMRPVGEDIYSELVMGLPFVNFTYRTN